MYWAKLRPELKQHVAVHAAYVDALCMAAGVPEALGALRKMLDLFAAQHHHRASLGQQPGQLSGADRTCPAPEAASQWAAAAPDSSSMGREDLSQPRTSSQAPLPQVQSAVSRDYLQNTSQGTSLQPDYAMVAEPPVGAMGLQLRMRQLEAGSQVDVIKGSEAVVEEHGVALRAAQAACHQVLNAAAKARQAGVSHKVLQAMHQVTLCTALVLLHTRVSSLHAHTSGGRGEGAVWRVAFPVCSCMSHLRAQHLLTHLEHSYPYRWEMARLSLPNSNSLV